MSFHPFLGHRRNSDLTRGITIGWYLTKEDRAFRKLLDSLICAFALLSATQVASRSALSRRVCPGLGEYMLFRVWGFSMNCNFGLILFSNDGGQIELSLKKAVNGML